jgi:16S rRNA processing protein RimM
VAASAQAPAGEGRLTVGLVRGLHGLRGALRVEVLTDDPARFEPGSVLWLAASERQLTVLDARSDRPPGLIVRFREIGDRRAAEALRDVYLEAEPARLPAGSYYWHEIEGLRVVTEAGAELGRVEDIFRVGEGEVYVVLGPGGEILVPAVKSVVRELSPAAGRMVVDGAALGLSEPE